MIHTPDVRIPVDGDAGSLRPEDVHAVSRLCILVPDEDTLNEHGISSHLPSICVSAFQGLDVGQDLLRPVDLRLPVLVIVGDH